MIRPQNGKMPLGALNGILINPPLRIVQCPAEARFRMFGHGPFGFSAPNSELAETQRCEQASFERVCIKTHTTDMVLLKPLLRNMKVQPGRFQGHGVAAPISRSFVFLEAWSAASRDMVKGPCDQQCSLRRPEVVSLSCLVVSRSDVGAGFKSFRSDLQVRSFLMRSDPPKSCGVLVVAFLNCSPWQLAVMPPAQYASFADHKLSVET